MRRPLLAAALLLATASACAPPTPEQALETHAQEALVLAYATGCGFVPPGRGVELLHQLEAEATGRNLADAPTLQEVGRQALIGAQRRPLRNCAVVSARFQAIQARLDRTSPAAQARPVRTAPGDSGWTTPAPR